jgi:hypothetical protein
VHVICEGQTEEEFIRHLLAPVLMEDRVSLLPFCVGKVGHKGGNVSLPSAAAPHEQQPQQRGNDDLQDQQRLGGGTLCHEGHQGHHAVEDDRANPERMVLPRSALSRLENQL